MDSEVSDLYAMADICGLRRIVLRCPDDELGPRVLSIRAHRNAVWSAFLDSFGNDARIVAHYTAWQTHLLEFADRHEASINPIYIDVGATDDLSRLCEIGDEIYQDLVAGEPAAP